MEEVPALEKPVTELTVMDVYDMASAVGQEFERLIDLHGCEAIGRLMPRVVRVLEILEVLVSRSAMEPEQHDLRLELERLRLERVERQEKDKKHQKELELVEDVWRGEAQDLLTQISQLQQENKQLMTNLTLKDVNLTEEEFQKHEGMSERERQVMKKLKEVVDKQRDEIRAKDRELGLKNEDVEATESNSDEYIFESDTSSMDLKDPNRPRFTLQELRDVLHERNELKAKVFLLQEEVAYYKSEEAEEENKLTHPTPIIHSKTQTPQESGIKRLFSFFSRDKKRALTSQKSVHFEESFGAWDEYNRENYYTEQGQEALQDL
ncbi:RILP-like protein 1 isoform X3 [Ambystoma mexicanum]|uniref:RILP-like protein 1 isoform X3 n=1 Tax=Ambystoma mexicanum TaxID=8296 RepID=UPI0037E7CA7D